MFRMNEHLSAGEENSAPSQAQGGYGYFAWFKRHQSKLYILVLVLGAGAFFNFMTFIQDSQRLGGSALGGYVQQGHYYVRGRGYSTEIPKADWEANRTKEIIAFTNLGLAGAAGFLIAVGHNGGVRNALKRGRRGTLLPIPDLIESPLMDKIMAEPEDTEPPVVEEDLTGHKLLAETTGAWGKVGNTTITVGGLSVSVFSDGIVVSAGVMGPATIKPNEVNLVTYKKRGTGAGVKIVQSSKEIDSPIFIGGVEEDSPFGQALNKVVGAAKVA